MCSLYSSDIVGIDVNNVLVAEVNVISFLLLLLLNKKIMSGVSLRTNC